jgi:hypothetical protein
MAFDKQPGRKNRFTTEAKEKRELEKTERQWRARQKKHGS